MTGSGPDWPDLACAVAILVDDAVWPWRDRMWCHLISDTSLDELHAFARRLGVPERGFGGDHYDIPAEVRHVAISEGALPVTSREVIYALTRAGLRQRRGGLRRAGSDASAADAG